MKRFKQGRTRGCSLKHSLSLPDLDQARSGLTKNMRSEIFNGCSLRAALHDMPPAPLRRFPKSCPRGKRTETYGLRSRQRTQATNQSRS
jgi:hypothetical protein